MRVQADSALEAAASLKVPAKNDRSSESRKSATFFKDWSTRLGVLPTPSKSSTISDVAETTTTTTNHAVSIVQEQHRIYNTLIETLSAQIEQQETVRKQRREALDELKRTAEALEQRNRSDITATPIDATNRKSLTDLPDCENRTSTKVGRAQTAPTGSVEELSVRVVRARADREHLLQLFTELKESLVESLENPQRLLKALKMPPPLAPARPKSLSVHLSPLPQSASAFSDARRSKTDISPSTTVVSPSSLLLAAVNDAALSARPPSISSETHQSMPDLSPRSTIISTPSPQTEYPLESTHFARPTSQSFSPLLDTRRSRTEFSPRTTESSPTSSVAESDRKTSYYVRPSSIMTVPLSPSPLSDMRRSRTEFSPTLPVSESARESAPLYVRPSSTMSGPLSSSPLSDTRRSKTESLSRTAVMSPTSPGSGSDRNATHYMLPSSSSSSSLSDSRRSRADLTLQTVVLTPTSSLSGAPIEMKNSSSSLYQTTRPQAQPLTDMRRSETSRERTNSTSSPLYQTMRTQTQTTDAQNIAVSRSTTLDTDRSPCITQRPTMDTPTAPPRSSSSQNVTEHDAIKASMEMLSTMLDGIHETPSSFSHIKLQK